MFQTHGIDNYCMSSSLFKRKRIRTLSVFKAFGRMFHSWFTRNCIECKSNLLVFRMEFLKILRLRLLQLHFSIKTDGESFQISDKKIHPYMDFQTSTINRYPAWMISHSSNKLNHLLNYLVQNANNALEFGLFYSFGSH